VSEASPADMAPEDMSVDMYPHHDLSQPAFPAVLPGTPPILTIETGPGANYLTWDSNRGADTHFYNPGQFLNLNNIYLLLPIVSPTLLPLPQTTVDSALSQDVFYTYSSPFFL
jgi:hypothetical protein